MRAGTDLIDRCVSAIVGGSVFGIPIQHVQEILGARPLTRVFRAPAAIAGVTSLRGEILTVLDLGKLLGIAPHMAYATESLRIVVVCESGGLRRRAGLQVEALGPVRELGRRPEAPAQRRRGRPSPAAVRGAVEPVPSTVLPEIRPFLLGILSEPPLCAVLDVGRILDAPVLASIAGRQLQEAP